MNELFLSTFFKAFMVFAFILEVFVCPTADKLFPALASRPIKYINIPHSLDPFLGCSEK